MLIDDLSFSLPRNGIVGVIGPNGTGKTTLFKMLIGEEQPDGGEVKIGETVKIAYVDQSRAGIDPKKGVDPVAAGPRRRELERELAAYSTPDQRCDLEAPLDRYPDSATGELREILAGQAAAAAPPPSAVSSPFG